ncbi:GxxExxY protein [Geothrix sp. PMB-07]|uniref:GxxExxY protein n=1 Tax=Geothrix sp. PMB-07 TaxID=3068640 RepID=UPI002740F98A|nr:GxxExxY protein [Geothrix sp. PMB-07]WLT32147.1 GxxExxY protein [Geothrix sp. PMB-07]
MNPEPGKDHHQDTKTPRKNLSPQEERIASLIVDAAIKVHPALGPGLLESVYETCLSHELRHRGLQVEAQVPVPIRYEGLTLDGGFRLDLLVEGLAVIELKALEKLLPVHDAQLLTCLKLSGRRLGFLLNFNVPVMKNGISRFVL